MASDAARDRGMRLFIDSANLEEIDAALKRGIAGVTTNSSILAREKISADRLLTYMETALYNVPLSIEYELVKPLWKARMVYYDALYVKVPVGWDTLELIRGLRGNDIKVNCTAIMSINQAIMAAGVGAEYVSLFWNRIKDGGEDPLHVVRVTRNLLDESGSKTQIIVGSIRQPTDVAEAFIAGAHAVTAPPAILKQLCEHPKTDEVVAQFQADARGALVDGHKH